MANNAPTPLAGWRSWLYALAATAAGACVLIAFVVVVGRPSRTVRELAQAGAVAFPATPLGSGVVWVQVEPSADVRAVLRLLQRVKSVDDLRLDGSRVSDTTVAALAQLPQLRYVSLNDTSLTDAAVPELLRLTWLEHLAISRTRITEAGRARLAAGLPKCQIVY